MNTPERFRVTVATCLSMAAAVLLLVAVRADAQDAAPDAEPMEVGVVTISRQEVPQVVTLPGRAVAFQEVEVRPRVGGVIEEILYTPGSTLSVGDPLFRIDDAAYRAAVASDEADLATARANQPVAQAAYDRARRLSGSGVTEAEVEAAQATLAEAQATLEASEAALEYSRTELSWTTITSPIDGRADVATVSVGDLVSAGQTDGLTTLVRSDPIDVDMLEASARLLSVRKKIHEGTLTRAEQVAATLTMENGDVYRGTGQLVSPGNIVSTTTGTFTLRFRFDNPEGLILPGMFLRGDITVGTTEAYLVPQLAATRGTSGRLTVFVVGDDGTARSVELTDQGSHDNAWIVSEGLAEGDLLIVDGLKSLQAGQAVSPVAATIDEDGVVRDDADADVDNAIGAGD